MSWGITKTQNLHSSSDLHNSNLTFGNIEHKSYDLRPIDKLNYVIGFSKMADTDTEFALFGILVLINGLIHLYFYKQLDLWT